MPQINMGASGAPQIGGNGSLLIPIGPNSTVGTRPGFASARLVPHAQPGTPNGQESTCEVEHLVSPTNAANAPGHFKPDDVAK